MRDNLAARLRLEKFIKDEVLFYSIVKFNSRKCYLCIASHFFYLFPENMSRDPFQFSFEQLSCVTCDPKNTSLIQLALTNFETQKDLVFETSDRDRVVRELRVHWKTDRVVRNWSFSTTDRTNKSFQLPVLYQSINAPQNQSKYDLKVSSGYKIVELFNQYFITLVNEFKENKTEENDSLRCTTFLHGSTGTTLKVTMVEERNWYHSANINLRTFAEKVATVSLLKTNIDFQLLQNTVFNKERPLFEEDKTIWLGYEIVLEATYEKRTFVHGVVVVRRMYLPPEGENYQDFVFELRRPKTSNDTIVAVHDQLNQIVQSLNPLTRCFLYDTLLLKSRLESLNGDEDFYTWASKRMGMRPEFNLTEEEDTEHSSRADQFVSAILNLVNATDPNEQVLEAPFLIEQQIREILDPTHGEVSHTWRLKLAAYLAYFADAGSLGLGYSEKLSFATMVNMLKNDGTHDAIKGAIIALLDYFLHLKLCDGVYDQNKTLTARIEQVEAQANTKQDAILESMSMYDLSNDIDLDDQEWDAEEEEEEDLRETTIIQHGHRVLYQQIISKAVNVEPCHMNTTVFLKLLKLQYFDKLQLSAFVKLLSFAIRVAKEYEVLYGICLKVLEMLHSHPKQNEFQSLLTVYKPFLHALASLLQYDDHSLLTVVGEIFCKLTADSSLVKDWFAANGYMYFVVDNIEAIKTQPSLIAVLITVLKNCMDTPKHRNVIVEQCNIVPILVKCIQTKDFTAVSTGRMKMLQAATSTLWVLSADEDYGACLIEHEVIQHLVDLMYHVLVQYEQKNLTTDILVLLQNILGVIMVISSFEGYRDLVINASRHEKSTILIVMQLIQRVTASVTKTNSLPLEQVTVFFRIAFGMLLVISVSVDAIVEMDQHMLSFVLKDFSSTYQINHEDKKTDSIVQTLLQRLTKSEVELPASMGRK
jgi:hypothetical protein